MQLDFDPTKILRETPHDRWQFRWGFEFADKPTKVGGWRPATQISDMASMVNKDKLLWAFVEGKHWTTREMKIFARCPGCDFVNFEHLAVYMSGSGAIHHYGMRIQARGETITCLESGKVMRERREKPIDLYPEWTRV